MDRDGALNAQELDDVFSTAPESPWNVPPYANVAENNALGGLSLDGFLAEKVEKLMASQDYMEEIDCESFFDHIDDLIDLTCVGFARQLSILYYDDDDDDDCAHA